MLFTAVKRKLIENRLAVDCTHVPLSATLINDIIINSESTQHSLYCITQAQ